MKKKVVHLISSLKIGGAEVWLVDLIANLPNSLEHHVIYFYDGPNRLILDKKGIKTYHIKGWFPYDPFFLIQLYKTIKLINPTLIHSSLWAANFFARIYSRLFKVPLISTIHLGMDGDGLIRNMIDRLLLYNVPNHIIAVSDLVAQSLLNKKWVQYEKVTTIKNGIDFNRLQQPSSKEKSNLLTLDAQDFVIGAVGRFIERKNFPWLIKQFTLINKHRPQAKLLILGIGPQEQELIALIHALNLTQTVKLIVGKQASAYYPFMHCFVQPSLQEGLSIALLEAMYFKRVCLVAAPTNNHDVIRHNENGLLFGLDDDSFIKSCLDLIDNKNLQKNLGNAAYESVCSNFSVNSMAEHYYKIYKQSNPLL